MSVIYVDQLVIRLPSDARNTFNPLYAFGSGGNGCVNGPGGHRSMGSMMGLREVQTGQVLLPMDAEGTVVVTPGQHYSVVLVRKSRGPTPATGTPRTDSTSTSSHRNDAHPTQAHHGKNSANVAAPKPSNEGLSKATVHQKQQPQQLPHAVQKPSQPHESTLLEPLAQTESRVASKEAAPKRDRKTARETAMESPRADAEAQLIPSVAAVTAPADQIHQNRKKKRQEGEAPPPQPYHAPSPASEARSEAEEVNDTPLMEAFMSSQPNPPSPSTSTVEPSPPSANYKSSKHASQRHIKETVPTTNVPLSPHTSPSYVSLATEGRGDEEIAKEGMANNGRPVSTSYQHQQKASKGVSDEAEESEEPATTTSSRRRRSPLEKAKPITTEAETIASFKPLEASLSKTTLQQKSVSPDRTPVTLPPSSRTSLLRRVPLDTSSDSD